MYVYVWQNYDKIGWGSMLELYITKGIHDCVISNDAFFDFDVSNGRKKFDKVCRDFMKKIDDAEYVDRYTVKSGLTNYNV